MRPASAEPVVLSVAKVREEIYQAARRAGPAGEGGRTSALAGQLLHETFAALMGPDPERNWQSALSQDDLKDARKLSRHVYQKLLGPRLGGYQAALQQSSREVLDLWQAAQQMCQWTVKMIETACEHRLLAYDPRTGLWAGAAELIAVEQELCWELKEPGWTRPVRISGIADAVWRKPGTGEWCLVEYKLGRTAPEADLAQACLYHEMLAAGIEDPAGRIAIVRFLPEIEEQLFSPEQLREAKQALRRLIGRIAGVGPGRSVPPPAPHGSRLLQPDTGPGQELLDTLKDFGTPVTLDGDPIQGPTFVRFVVEPEKGIRAAAVLRQALDLQVRLRLDAPPLVHVDRGRVVIDVQRRDRQTVLFSELASQLAPRGPLGSSLVPLGVDVEGALRCADLANPVNAHILVAGTSGSGKTEWLRTAIAGLVSTNQPDSLRLVVIDPKRNAFGALRNSPYLYDAESLVYPPDISPVETLEKLIQEMERRYRLLESSGADDLAAHRRATGEMLPRIVCVCDEYADLVAPGRTVRREIETRVARLGGKARAAGIHLLIATQRPSREIVAGTLQANMSCRVALKMQSAIESRMVLGDVGAENLLGHGDLLFRDIGRPVRLQAPLLPESQRAALLGAGIQPVTSAGSRGGA